MPVRLETNLINLETEQYAGEGQRSPGLSDIAESARAIEALGYDGATSPEAGHDPFLPLAIAAEHTRRIHLATNVAIAFPRSPMVTAQIAWDLQHLSGGRFQLGLGTQVKGHNERRYVAPWTGPPGPRLREYVCCLKAMFASFQHPTDPTYFEGEHYRFTMMPPFFNPGPIEHPEVPIYVGLVNQYMARVAGELCNGVRLHPIGTFHYTREVIRPAIERGAKKAGRTATEIDVVGAPFMALGVDEEDVERAKQALKQRIAFYASTRTYHAVLESHDWMDVGAKLHRLSVEGKWQELPNCITDEMLEEWAVVATYDAFVDTFRERCGSTFSTVLLDLPAGLRQDEARMREIMQALRSS
jgi:probable F420-dependent oxidoreductase